MRYVPIPLFAAFLLSLNALGVEFIARRPVDTSAAYVLADHSRFYHILAGVILAVLVFCALVVLRRKNLASEDKIFRKAIAEDYEEGLP